MPPHRANHGNRILGRQIACAIAGLAVSLMATTLFANARAETIKIPGDKTYPESITSTADGTVIIGSLGTGEIWRAAPGTSTAELWIKPGSNGLLSALGVLADDRTGLRSYGDKLLMIEGEGRLDLVSIDGDKARIDVVQDGFKAPVSLTKVGRTLWVLEGQLPHLFDAKTGKPDPFQATSLTAPPQ